MIFCYTYDRKTKEQSHSKMYFFYGKEILSVIVVQGSSFGIKSAIKSAVKTGAYSLGGHIHQFSEIVFVRGGSINVTVEGRTETAKQNDIIVIAPFQVHSFDTEKYCDIKLCLFSNDILPEFIPPDDMYTAGSRAIFSPSYELLVYVKDKIPDTGEEILHMDGSNIDLFRRVKAALFAIFEEYRIKVPTVKTDGKSDILPRVLLWMKKNYTKDVNMQDAARELGYTVGYISHSLESIKNINFRGLLNSIRIEHACALLGKTDKKIIDIALECGFTCERSFHRSFLAIVGVTPGVYRKKGVSMLYSVPPVFAKNNKN